MTGTLIWPFVLEQLELHGQRNYDQLRDALQHDRHAIISALSKMFATGEVGCDAAPKTQNKPFYITDKGRERLKGWLSSKGAEFVSDVYGSRGDAPVKTNGGGGAVRSAIAEQQPDTDAGALRLMAKRLLEIADRIEGSSTTDNEALASALELALEAVRGNA